MSRHMSVAQDTTYDLFSSFMPRSKEIPNRLNSWIYDLRIYPQEYFTKFNPKAKFNKYALVEVGTPVHIPECMEEFTLEGGNYAVFTPRDGTAGFKVFEYIFTKWLPGSGYLLEPRPHFEKLQGDTHKNDTNKSELIFIPVSAKRL